MTNSSRGTLAERLAAVREQDRYQADVEEHGLEALLAPYANATALPKQRPASA